MIDAACRQSSYLLPLLTNTGNSNNKMKRNTTNDNEDELTSTSLIGMRTHNHKKLLPPRKKLKFGVDAILGTYSDNESSFDAGNDSDDDLRHKGEHLFHHIVLITLQKYIREKKVLDKVFLKRFPIMEHDILKSNFMLIEIEECQN